MYKITFEYIKEGNAILPKGYIKRVKALDKQDLDDNLECHSKDKWRVVSIEEYVVRYLNKSLKEKYEKV